MSVNYLIGQRKAFYEERIPESSYVMKETVDIEILVISRNGDRSNNEYTFLKNKEVETVEPVQMNIYQSNIYRKDLSWLHFKDEPRVQERQQVKDQKSKISVFPSYLTFSSSGYEHQPRHDNSIQCKAVWYIYRDTEQPQEKETS